MIASVATTRTLVLQRSAACSHQRQQIQRRVTVLCLMSYSPRVALNLHFVSAPSVPINRQPSQATLISRRHNAYMF